MLVRSIGALLSSPVRRQRSAREFQNGVRADVSLAGTTPMLVPFARRIDASGAGNHLEVEPTRMALSQIARALESGMLSMLEVLATCSLVESEAAVEIRGAFDCYYGDRICISLWTAIGASPWWADWSCRRMIAGECRSKKRTIMDIRCIQSFTSLSNS